MRRSIRRRVALTFIFLMAVFLLAIGAFQYFFMDDIYFREKRKNILVSWEMINASADSEPGDAFLRFCQVNGLDYCIADGNMNALYANTPNTELMLGRLLGNVLDIEEENTTVLQETEQYRVIRIHDRFQAMDFLELWGVLDNGNYYMVHSPIQGISEAAAISVRVYFLLGLAMIAVGAVVIALTTKRIVKPIQELTGLSKRMAGLDFDARYESGGEDEIGELGRNFNTMSERLQRAVGDLREANAQLERDIAEKTEQERRGREFIANVSHELKTPIALVQGYAEGLRDNVNEDAASREFYCDVIVDEAGKMNRLVKQLLDLDQLESGREPLAIGTFDLAALIRGVASSAKLLVEQAGAELVLDLPERLAAEGDEFKIEEVVTNYLNNALHHAGGERRIRIRCETEGGQIRTSVFNTGEPIPEEELPRIWDKFYKVDKAHTREYGGSGIGLAIVKAITEAHGQSCGVRNVEGGVEFFFTVKKAEA